MKKGCLVGGIAGLLALIAIVVLWGIGIYNGIIPKNNAVNGQWANVETAYQKRADLTEQLVATVKGARDFEQETLTQVIEARAKATSVNIDPSNLDPSDLAKFQQAQDGLSSALNRLMVVVERYPDLNQIRIFFRFRLHWKAWRTKFVLNRRNSTIRHRNTTIISKKFQTI